jgi:hypothetical protein
MEERVRSWTPPSRVSPEVRREASNRAGTLTAILNSKAGPTIARVWLLQLATVTAGSKPLSELQAQVDGMVGLMNYPSSVFTPETLREAAQRFKFFPGYAEIHALFEPLVKQWETELKRCEQIAHPQSAPSNAPFVHDTPEQMRSVSELLDRSFGEGWRERSKFPGAR